MTNLILKGEKTGQEFIFMLFALLSLITCGLVFMFPETKDKEIPDSVYETENYSPNKKVNQKIYQNNWYIIIN